MKRRFDEALQIGRTGEKQTADDLENAGWFVIPSYDYTGEDGNKAPKMKRRNEALVVPDLDACREGERIWVEVKTKSEPTLHRKTNTLEHGINLRHWESYKRIERETGSRVWICIRELSSDDVLLQHTEKLSEVVRHGTGRGSGMVYFPRSAFQKARKDPNIRVW